MKFCESPVNIGIMNKKHNMIGIKQIAPKNQSKLNNNIKNAIGVTTAPNKSNSWCAKNPSVVEYEKSIIYL